MPDYQNGKIYTIRCRTDETLIYVGSTTQPLAKRWGGHKKDSRTEICQNRLIYNTINGNWDDWHIELYEVYPCENREQLCRREGEIIRGIGTLNFAIAGRTRKEWGQEYRENNIDKIKLTKKEYYENNADKIKEQTTLYRENNSEKLKEKRKDKITCECGCILRKKSLPRHLKTKKHIETLNPV